MYDDLHDDHEMTEFDPQPWGSREPALPRRSLPLPPPAPNLAARIANAEHVERLHQPVREADIPTWRIPKVSDLGDIDVRQRIGLRMWLPIGGLVAIALIALLVPRFGSTELRPGATSISAALGGETSNDQFHLVATVEEPPAAPAVVAPPPVHRTPTLANARAKHVSKRPPISFDVSTPLGDLVKHHR